MMNTLMKRVLGLGLLVLLPTLSYAEAPSGSYAFYFDRQQGVWDLSGYFPFSELYGATGDLTIVQDNKGKISGQGTVAGSQEGYTADVDFTVSGSIKSLGNVTRVSLKTKIVGTVGDGYDEWNIKGKITLIGDVDKSTGSLIGTAKGKICVQGADCLPIEEATTLDLPPEANGFWDLYMDIHSVDGKKLTGTASAELYNLAGGLRTVPLTLKGKYDAATGMTKLSLKGSGGKFAIQAYTSDLILQAITGKLLGQAVNQ